MAMRAGGISRTWLLAVVLIFSFPVHGIEGQNAPTVVEVYKTPRGIGYKVDSKKADLTPATSFLHLLALVYEEKGASAPVIVLLDPHVPLDQIDNVDGTAGKAQLNNLRYFIFYRETRKMTEIKFGPTLPYSMNPPQN